jgi:hypothetical protein
MFPDEAGKLFQARYVKEALKRENMVLGYSIWPARGSGTGTAAPGRSLGSHAGSPAAEMTNYSWAMGRW